MGTYHFRRLFGKHLTGVTSSTRVSRQGHGARLSGVGYAITVPLGSPTAADRSPTRGRARAPTRKGATARRKRGATGVSDGELRAGVVGDPKAAWVRHLRRTRGAFSESRTKHVRGWRLRGRSVLLYQQTSSHGTSAAAQSFAVAVAVETSLPVAFAVDALSSVSLDDEDEPD